MNQIADFFKGLFDTSLWPARWHCGTWSDFHGWMYIVSDLTIWLAYFLIPAFILDYIIKKKKAIKFQRIYLLFAAFILLCGTTHFFDAMAFWIPMYRLNGLVRCLTAIVSILTAFYLVRLLPRIFRQQTNLELEAEISKRIAIEKELKLANSDLEMFAYAASHDLQEPLRKIMTYSSRLVEESNDQDANSKELTTKIFSSADKLKKMTTGILNLSGLRGSVPMAMTSLEEVVRAALADLEYSIARKRARIDIGPLPIIYCSSIYMYQVFLNLIGNAIKYSERTPEIAITAVATKKHITIQVADNGIGIKPEGREKVFNPFERLDVGSTYEGSGIGLALCKRIVEIHNGRISVESTPGSGSVFIMEFPLSILRGPARSE